MGFFNFLERTAGDSKIGTDFIKYGKDYGKPLIDKGSALIDTEIGNLRGLSSDYRSRLANPLGEGPNSASGIFRRARGSLSDVATGRAGAFSSRLSQQALQGGGRLSPEAIAQLTEQNQRNINQDLFTGNASISDAEAQLTLSETSKLFDRMEGISKTILGVGTDTRLTGLQALLNSLNLRRERMTAIASAGTSAGTGAYTAGFGKSGGSNPIG